MLLNGKKFCGILTEMNAEATRVRHLVVGIGINVNQAKFPAELREIATSLRLEPGTRVVAGGVVRGFAKIARPRVSRACWRMPEARESILRALSGAFVVGARADGANRREWRRSKASPKGLDPRGFLQVQDREGLRTVLSGTVRNL